MEAEKIKNIRQEYVVLNEQQSASEIDPFTIERYRQFFRHFQSGIRVVLDVGCNTGRGGRAIKELNPELSIVGLDCVESRLARLPKDVYEHVLCAYSTSISCDSSSFDAIIAGEFIEHLRPEDVEPTLTEFFRILRSGGQLLLTTPNPDYIRLKLSGSSVLGGAHFSQHYPKILKKTLEKIGFNNVKIFGSGKVSRYLGEHIPFLFLYGSYLAEADKP